MTIDSLQHILKKISGKQYNVGGDVTIEGDKVMIKGFR